MAIDNSESEKLWLGKFDRGWTGWANVGQLFKFTHFPTVCSSYIVRPRISVGNRIFFRRHRRQGFRKCRQRPQGFQWGIKETGEQKMGSKWENEKVGNFLEILI